jgi:vancomycin resistance protein YoaR
MRALALTALLGMALAVAVLLVAPLAYGERIHPGIAVGEVTVGGLTPAEAAAQLEDRISPALAQPLLLSAGGSEPVEASPASLGFQLDAAASAEKANREGRDVPYWRQSASLVLGLLRSRAVSFELLLDETTFLAAGDELALKFERLPTDAHLLLTDQGPKVIASAAGVRLDRDRLQASLRRAVIERRREVRLPLEVLEPTVATEQAREALTAAKQAFASPVTLTYRESELRLEPGEIARLASLSPGAALSDHPLVFDSEEARTRLEELVRPLAPPPVDARIELAQDGRNYEIIPGREGATIDWDAFLPALSRVVSEPAPRRLPVPTRVTYPAVSTLDAQELVDSRRIVSFTTYFNPANTPRVNNIRQVSRLLDGRLVRPGETFSFNQAVGPRTKAAGFDEAPVIVDGALTPGVGGGICQVSTTLFNAVFLAGLPVLERKPHSIYLENYPLGRDATVAWGSIDFRFKNDSEHVLLLGVETGESSVEVILSAIGWDRKVTYETSPFRNLTPPKSTAAKPRRLRDPSLARGEVAPVEPGGDGRTIEVSRRVTRADGSLLFEDTFLSEYRPKDYIVRVGG